MRNHLLIPLAVLLALASTVGAAGTSSSSASAELFTLHQARDFFQLEKRLPELAAGDLSRWFFEGQMAAAFREDEAAEQALQHFLAAPGTDAEWRKEASLTLGGSRLRRGLYGQAAAALDQALHEPGARFTDQERRDASQTYAVAHALRDVPAMRRTSGHGVGTLTTSRDKAGLLNVETSVNGRCEGAVFDTGANFCCASESYARRHGLRLLAGRVNVQAASGNTVAVQLGLAERLQLGTTTMRQIVFLVFRDEDLSFPQIGYQIHAIVGLPVIVALERLRFAAGERSIAIGESVQGAATTATPSSSVSRKLALDGLMPLVRVEYGGESLTFKLDTGATKTELAARFGRRFPAAVAGASERDVRQGSAGGGSGVAPVTVRTVPALTFNVGATSTTLHEVSVRASDDPSGDPAYGTVGRDFLAPGFELDFRRMQFALLSGRQTP